MRVLLKQNREYSNQQNEYSHDVFLPSRIYKVVREIKDLGWLCKTGVSVNENELTVIRYENGELFD